MNQTRQFGEKPGVLVVDDEHLARSMVQLGLERNGFEVCSAPHGREAINLYRAHGEAIDVVLLEVRLPGLDGPQTLDALRELNRELPACFMGGDTGAYAPDKLAKRYDAQVIAKPFMIDDLVDILRRLTHVVPAARLPLDGSMPRVKS
jgi:DNA-binding NtrC family response regulator